MRDSKGQPLNPGDECDYSGDGSCDIMPGGPVRVSRVLVPTDRVGRDVLVMTDDGNFAAWVSPDTLTRRGGVESLLDDWRGDDAKGREA